MKIAVNITTREEYNEVLKHHQSNFSHDAFAAYGSDLCIDIMDNCCYGDKDSFEKSKYSIITMEEFRKIPILAVTDENEEEMIDITIRLTAEERLSLLDQLLINDCKPSEFFSKALGDYLKEESNE